MLYIYISGFVKYIYANTPDLYCQVLDQGCGQKPLVRGDLAWGSETGFLWKGLLFVPKFSEKPGFLSVGYQLLVTTPLYQCQGRNKIHSQEGFGNNHNPGIPFSKNNATITLNIILSAVKTFDFAPFSISPETG